MLLGISFLFFILFVAFIFWLAMIQLEVHDKARDKFESFNKEKLEEKDDENVR
jgi:hypothetical protein